MVFIYTCLLHTQLFAQLLYPSNQYSILLMQNSKLLVSLSGFIHAGCPKRGELIYLRLHLIALPHQSFDIVIL